MARIFLWRPSIADGNVGHLSMELDFDKTYISFWPNKLSKVKTLIDGEATNYTLQQDIINEGRNYDDYFAIPDSLIDHTKIVAWWKDYRPKLYSLLEYNCARCIYDALQSSGLDVFKHDHVKEVGIHMRSPDDEDYDYETMQEIWHGGGIESKPVKPETEFEWIKKYVNQKMNGEKSKKKCIVS
jgi:hypothetical protein